MAALRALGSFVRLVTLTVVVIAAAGFAVASAGERRAVASLRVGDSAFWNGTVASSPSGGSPLPVPIPSLVDDGKQQEDGCGADCAEFAIELLASGRQLRVAVDTPDCSSEVALELIDPDGDVRDQESSCYSAEVYARSPDKGTWVARVSSSSGRPTFRMRAKLEGSVKPRDGRHALLPNLRVEPPHDFGFLGDGVNLASRSCYQEEVVEDGAERCLRFAVGPQNVGSGPLELRFARETNLGTDASMQQRVYYSDGSAEMRDAGSSEFHKAHQHFHLKGFARFSLFRVTDRSEGTLRKAGIGNKAGFCLVDLRIAQWRRFNQQRSYSARSSCMPVAGKAELGLSAGWTDVYGAELSGNYIDFGDNKDGYYVVRTVVDSSDFILESNERDNVGYAYIQVDGGSVSLLERGQGSSPWDPRKVVFREWWRGLS